MTEGETAAREELLRELEAVEGELRAVEQARHRRTEVDAALRAARGRREADRLRALAALGLRPTRLVPVCRGAREGVAARPRRCPGCDAIVVDPRGLALDAIAAQLGAPGGWIVREDGLVASRACAEVRERARRRRMLARGLGSACAVTMLATLAALAVLLRPPPAAHLVSLSETAPVGTRIAPFDPTPLPPEPPPHFVCRYPLRSTR